MARLVLGAPAMIRNGSLWRIAAGLGVVFALSSPVIGPATAEAQVVLRPGIETTLLLDEYAREETQWEADPGLGPRIVFGYRIVTADLHVTPELASSYTWFGDDYARRTLRVTLGARLRLSGDIAPSVYLRVGYAGSEGEDGDASLSRHGTAIDAGGGFSLMLSPIVGVGVDLRYGAQISETGSGIEVQHLLGLGVEAIVVLDV